MLKKKGNTKSIFKAGAMIGATLVPLAANQVENTAGATFNSNKSNSSTSNSLFGLLKSAPSFLNKCISYSFGYAFRHAKSWFTGATKNVAKVDDTVAVQTNTPKYSEKDTNNNKNISLNHSFNQHNPNGNSTTNNKTQISDTKNKSATQQPETNNLQNKITNYSNDIRTEIANNRINFKDVNKSVAKDSNTTDSEKKRNTETQSSKKNSQKYLEDLIYKRNNGPTKEEVYKELEKIISPLKSIRKICKNQRNYVVAAEFVIKQLKALIKDDLNMYAKYYYAYKDSNIDDSDTYLGECFVCSTTLHSLQKWCKKNATEKFQKKVDGLYNKYKIEYEIYNNYGLFSDIFSTKRDVNALESSEKKMAESVFEKIFEIEKNSKYYNKKFAAFFKCMSILTSNHSTGFSSNDTENYSARIERGDDEFEYLSRIKKFFQNNYFFSTSNYIINDVEDFERALTLYDTVENSKKYNQLFLRFLSDYVAKGQNSSTVKKFASEIFGKFEKNYFHTSNNKSEQIKKLFFEVLNIIAEKRITTENRYKQCVELLNNSIEISDNSRNISKDFFDALSAWAKEYTEKDFCEEIEKIIKNK